AETNQTSLRFIYTQVQQCVVQFAKRLQGPKRITKFLNFRWIGWQARLRTTHGEIRVALFTIQDQRQVFVINARGLEFRLDGIEFDAVTQTNSLRYIVNEPLHTLVDPLVEFAGGEVVVN